MKQSAEQEKKTRAAPKKRMSNFKKAMMWTAISILALEFIGPWQYVPTGIFAMALPWSWAARLGAILAAVIIAAIIFSIRRKGQIARGIWVGLGIAVGITIITIFFIFSITCFATLG